ncbi:MAG: hypothetical protein M1829_000266 [Trizodia sp. TS-e1964]|nr:MAG: hypothetical protein M1829_000266 [Trizodia sp. TS-e1964]
MATELCWSVATNWPSVSGGGAKGSTSSTSERVVFNSFNGPRIITSQIEPLCDRVFLACTFLALTENTVRENGLGRQPYSRLLSGCWTEADQALQQQSINPTAYCLRKGIAPKPTDSSFFQQSNFSKPPSIELKPSYYDPASTVNKLRGHLIRTWAGIPEAGYM